MLIIWSHPAGVAAAYLKEVDDESIREPGRWFINLKYESISARTDIDLQKRHTVAFDTWSGPTPSSVADDDLTMYRGIRSLDIDCYMFVVSPNAYRIGSASQSNAA